MKKHMLTSNSGEKALMMITLQGLLHIGNLSVGPEQGLWAVLVISTYESPSIWWIVL